MCLILFHWDPDGDIPLTVLANRDEFHDRPALQADFWQDHQDILAGRDERRAGTWLGVTAGGRFAAVTNYRSPRDMQPGGRSRGELPVAFLNARDRSMAFLESILAEGDQWAGFNLLVYDGVDLAYGSNRDTAGPQLITPGVHGLSNALLNTSWPKVDSGKQELEALLSGSVEESGAEEGWLNVLASREEAEDDLLPDTGIGLEKERLLSARRIVSEGYGTRCSTLVRIGWDGQMEFVEKTWIPRSLDQDTVAFSIEPL